MKSPVFLLILQTEKTTTLLIRPRFISLSIRSLAGLILESCESIPVENQELFIHPYQIKILKMGQNSPEDLQVTFLD